MQGDRGHTERSGVAQQPLAEAQRVQARLRIQQNSAEDGADAVDVEARVNISL